MEDHLEDDIEDQNNCHRLKQKAFKSWTVSKHVIVSKYQDVIDDFNDFLEEIQIIDQPSSNSHLPTPRPEFCIPADLSFLGNYHHTSNLSSTLT